MGDLWGEEGFGGSGFGGESFGGEDDWDTGEESIETDLEEGLGADLDEGLDDDLEDDEDRVDLADDFEPVGADDESDG